MHGRTLMLLSISLTLACGGAASEAGTTTTTTTAATGTTTTTTTAEPETAGASDPVREATAEEPEPQTTTSSDALARYAGEIMERIRLHWAVPASISAGEVQSLEARVEITVDDSQVPTAFQILEGSGNLLFDESVERALRDLVTAAERLPDPPAGLDDRGHVRLRLRGRRGQ